MNSAEWYAQQQIRTGNPLWAIPGTIASCWTPETWKATTLTLGAGYAVSGWAARTGPTVTWRGGEIVIKNGEKTTFRFNPFGNPEDTGPGGLPHYHRRPGIDQHRPWQRGW